MPGRGEVCVPLASSTALQQEDLLSFFDEIYEKLPGILIVDRGPRRHIDDGVLPVPSVPVPTAPVTPAFSLYGSCSCEMNERTQVSAAPQDHVAAATSVTTVGSTLWCVLLPAE